MRRMGERREIGFFDFAFFIGNIIQRAEQCAAFSSRLYIYSYFRNGCFQASSIPISLAESHCSSIAKSSKQRFRRATVKKCYHDVTGTPLVFICTGGTKLMVGIENSI